MMKNDEFMQKDLQFNWHPCTQMKDHEFLPLIPIKKAKGVYLEDFEGNKYIDSISSWWVNIFGHSNEYINEALKKQLETLEHVIFAGFTHEGAVKLSERLCNLTKLDKVFYADNGSSAVEIALKMAFHYYLNKGEKRELFFSLKNSYHGETIGALSVGDVDLYKKTYEPLLIKSIQLPIPKDKSDEEAKKSLKEARSYFEKYHKQVSSLIIEPLVQCAGNMKMHSPIFVKGLKELCDEFDIKLILDEIAVGFGRTGTMFAHFQAGIKPDFLCLSKGLTGGYMPLSCVLTTDEIYQEFYCDYTKLKAFLHSHSYTANPLAISAANATLDLFERSDVIAENRKKAQYIWSNIQRFKNLKNVKEIRQTGMITAIEMIDYPFEKRAGLEVYKYGLKNGVLLRPLGNVIYFMPPYVITYEEIDKMINTAYEGIKCLEDR
jgi:adenosylmethionine-8-amino-7-oxononanoate aminotransferase